MSDNQISEKTTIPLGWAAIIVMSLAGVVFTGGMTHARFQGLEAKVMAAQVLSAANEKANQDRDLKLQRLDLTLNTIDRRLESIDRKLDRMERK